MPPGFEQSLDRIIHRNFYHLLRLSLNQTYYVARPVHIKLGKSERVVLPESRVQNQNANIFRPIRLKFGKKLCFVFGSQYPVLDIIELRFFNTRTRIKFQEIILDRQRKDFRDNGKFTQNSCRFANRFVLSFRVSSKMLELFNMLEAEKENFTREREELEEEHNVEDGLMESARDETTDKLTKGSVKERIKKLKFEKDLGDELKVLEKYLELVESEAVANRNVRTAKAELDLLVFKQYEKLDIDEIKTLVIDDKWMTTLEAAIKSELERIAQNLTQRIKTLAVRYETPLPQISEEAESLSARVDAHLAKMGFAFELNSKTANLEI